MHPPHQVRRETPILGSEPGRAKRSICHGCGVMLSGRVQASQRGKTFAKAVIVRGGSRVVKALIGRVLVPQLVRPLSCLWDRIHGFGGWCGHGWHCRWCGWGKRGGCVGRGNSTVSVRDLAITVPGHSIHQGLSLAGEDPIKGRQASM
jgi:hypothetical protein